MHPEIDELLHALDRLWPSLNLHELAVFVSADGTSVRVDVAHEAPQVIEATEKRDRYLRWLKHTKHLYAEIGKGFDHVDLVHRGRALLPDMVANKPDPRHHEVIDNNTIPRTVSEWVLVFHRIAPRVIPAP